MSTSRSLPDHSDVSNDSYKKKIVVEQSGKLHYEPVAKASAVSSSNAGYLPNG